MNPDKLDTPANFGSQSGKAKSKKARLIARISRLVREAGVTYDDWRYVSKHVRRKCDLHAGKKQRKAASGTECR